MNPDLLIPATAALLDGWCGPVVTVYGGVASSLFHGVWFDGMLCDEGGPVDDPDEYKVALDLGRAECRDRVARVLAAARELPPGVAWLTLRAGILEKNWPVYTTDAEGVVQYGTQAEMHVPTYALLSTQPRQGRTVRNFGARQIPYKTREFFDYVIPALATLDPHDDTRLPDGSRLVDALALAAVARATFTTTGETR